MKLLNNLLCRIAFIVCVIVASPISVAKETIKLADDRKIEVNGTAEFQFDLKEVPKGKQVRLYLDARIEWSSLGGNTTAMTPVVNEKGVVGGMLINKPLNKQ
jgi:hypothetical protein